MFLVGYWTCGSIHWQEHTLCLHFNLMMRIVKSPPSLSSAMYTFWSHSALSPLQPASIIETGQLQVYFDVPPARQWSYSDPWEAQTESVLNCYVSWERIASEVLHGLPGQDDCAWEDCISSAGVMAVAERNLTVDGFETQFGTNHVGHHLLFQLLKPALLAASTPEFNSRVVSLSSLGEHFSPCVVLAANLVRASFWQTLNYCLGHVVTCRFRLGSISSQSMTQIRYMSCPSRSRCCLHHLALSMYIGWWRCPVNVLVAMHTCQCQGTWIIPDTSSTQVHKTPQEKGWVDSVAVLFGFITYKLLTVLGKLSQGFSGLKTYWTWVLLFTGRFIDLWPPWTAVQVIAPRQFCLMTWTTRRHLTTSGKRMASQRLQTFIWQTRLSADMAVKVRAKSNAAFECICKQGP